jgi:hypothetical protein
MHDRFTLECVAAVAAHVIRVLALLTVVYITPLLPMVQSLTLTVLFRLICWVDKCTQRLHKELQACFRCSSDVTEPCTRSVAGAAASGQRWYLHQAVQKLSDVTRSSMR